MGRNIDHGLAVTHGTAQGTVSLADVGSENVTTAAAYGRFPADSGDFFGCFIECRYTPVLVDGKNALIY
jgi:hypothetical protein